MGKSKKQRANKKETGAPGGAGWDTGAKGKTPKSTLLETPVKPPNDSREYRLVELASGLEVLLISAAKDDENDGSDDEEYSDEEEDEEDEGQKNAAVALSIGVGSYSDPESVPGLAHFLEHMVFMGSKKYPDENDFDAFLSKHSGESDGGATLLSTHILPSLAITLLVAICAFRDGRRVDALFFRCRPRPSGRRFGSFRSVLYQSTAEARGSSTRAEGHRERVLRGAAGAVSTLFVVYRTVDCAD